VNGLKHALTVPKRTLLAASAAKLFGSPAIHMIQPVNSIPRAIPHFLFTLAFSFPK